MHESTGGASPQRADSVRLEVLRPDDGASIYARILQEGPILGAYFHYDRRRGSSPCAGDACGCKGRRTGAQWKGYVAAEEWTPGPGYWRPGALEITEHCCLEMNGFVKRGEVWVLSREAKQPGKAGKVSAVLSERVEADKVRPPFDLGPILYHLLRVQVTLNERCPVPPKPVLEVTPGSPPAKLVDQQHEALSPEEIRARLRAAGIEPPTVESNGRKSTVRRY